MIQIVPASGRIPIVILPEQLDIEPVEPPCGLDVERVFANLLDGGDAGKRQEKTKMVVEIGVFASDCFAIQQILRLEGFAVGGQDELGFLAGRGGAIAQAASVAATSPSAQTLRWMLLRCSTPPRSD